MNLVIQYEKQSKRAERINKVNRIATPHTIEEIATTAQTICNDFTNYNYKGWMIVGTPSYTIAENNRVSFNYAVSVGRGIQTIDWPDFAEHLKKVFNERLEPVSTYPQLTERVSNIDANDIDEEAQKLQKEYYKQIGIKEDKPNLFRRLISWITELKCS